MKAANYWQHSTRSDAHPLPRSPPFPGRCFGTQKWDLRGFCVCNVTVPFLRANAMSRKATVNFRRSNVCFTRSHGVAQLTFTLNRDSGFLFDLSQSRRVWHLTCHFENTHTPHTADILVRSMVLRPDQKRFSIDQFYQIEELRTAPREKATKACAGSSDSSACRSGDTGPSSGKVCRIKMALRIQILNSVDGASPAWIFFWVLGGPCSRSLPPTRDSSRHFPHRSLNHFFQAGHKIATEYRDSCQRWRLVWAKGFRQPPWPSFAARISTPGKHIQQQFTYPVITLIVSSSLEILVDHCWPGRCTPGSDVTRSSNLGSAPCWCLALFVPIIHLFQAQRCAAVRSLHSALRAQPSWPWPMPLRPRPQPGFHVTHCPYSCHGDESWTLVATHAWKALCWTLACCFALHEHCGRVLLTQLTPKRVPLDPG